MDILLIVFLILLNGLFSMAEMAVVSSRKIKLHSLAEEGKQGAEAALALNQEPSRFLSTIQVGITSVGILSGAIGELAFVDPIANWLRALPELAPYARGMAMTLTVVGLTYFSVVVGELIPKQLALWAPEWIASAIARPMIFFSRLTYPLTVLLSGSSTLFLRILGIRKKNEPPVTDNEINVLMEEGAKAGIFHASEQAFVSNVLRLDIMRINTIMTPRPDMVYIDLDEDEQAVRKNLMESNFSRLIVCRGGLDNIVGVIKTSDLLRKVAPGLPITITDIEAAMQPALYVPESVTTTQLLENFRKARIQFALIVDEYGEVQGLVTLTDVLAAIVGEHNIPEIHEERDIVQRDDGSWLVEGSISMGKLQLAINAVETWREPDDTSFNTLGGFIMNRLGHVPSITENFIAFGFRFEVVDMDGNRVDKVLISKTDEG
ncbi:MAG: HlyC/CorC family transporter [Oxalobacter sp.]|nr:MAG: HlyC/CorC family transporter [Oxalobacter sp.]